jgi:hypothetical protein
MSVEAEMKRRASAQVSHPTVVDVMVGARS